MSHKILIVEDEPVVAELLRDYLLNAGFTAYILDSGLEVEEWVRGHLPDLILLDLMLPGKDGIALCKDIRYFSEVPIIMVTARVDEIDRLLGLELGADDYICKPFSPREVVARVKAVLKRSVMGDHNIEQFVQVDREGFRVLVQGKDLGLTGVEYKLFVTLHRHPGRIFSRTQLMEHIYEDNRIVNDRTVDSHVKKLRLKIAKLNVGVELIHSVYGIGYKYEC